MKIIGYIQATGIDEGLLPLVDFGLMTHAVWEGVKVTGPTDPTLVEYYGYPLSQITDCVNAGHAAGTKVLAALFGTMNDLALVDADPAMREQLLDNLVDLTTAYNLDGIEVDWEQSTAQPQIDALVIDLYNRLNPLGKMVTVAVYPNDHMVSNAVDPYVEWIDVLCYGWNKDTGEHALYEDCVDSMEFWASYGHPKNKLIMGMPFAGKSPRDAAGNYIWARYVQIVDNFPGLTSDQNYYYADTWVDGRAIPGGYIWFNGIDLARQKVDFLLDGKYGGVMCYSVAWMDKLNDPRSLLQNIYDEVNTHRPKTLALLGIGVVLGIIAIRKTKLETVAAT